MPRITLYLAVTVATNIAVSEANDLTISVANYESLLDRISQLEKKESKIEMDNMDEQPSILHKWSSASSVTGFGHISLQLLSSKCYISFWPKKGTKRCDIMNTSCPAEWFRTIKEEIDANGHPTSVFIYGLNEIAIKSWWEKFTADEPKYDLREQNCASVVYNALCKGSNWFEKNTGDCTGIKTPTRVFQFVQNGYNKTTKIGCGCSCKHCMCLYPYLGFGSFTNYVYKLYLVPLNTWKSFKHLFHKPGQGKTISICGPEDPSSNGEEIDESINDAKDCKDLHEKKANVQSGIQHESIEDFIDLRSKVRTTSLPDIKLICQPDIDTQDETMLVLSTCELNVRYRNKQGGVS